MKKQKPEALSKQGVQHTQASASRPAKCAACGQFVGRSYPHCALCREVAERPIRTAWQELLRVRKIEAGTAEESALVAEVLEQAQDYWWSEVEAALRLTPCPTCGGPLGYGAPECQDCWTNSYMYWGRDYELNTDGVMVRNEHALRVALRGLAQEKRHSRASLDGWRLYLPFLLLDIEHGPGFTRQDTIYAQTIGAWIKSGRSAELFQCQSIEEMYALTRQGRR